MRILLLSLSSILLSCSLGTYKNKEDSLVAKDFFDCEDQIGHYSQCFIKFHTQDCESVKKSLIDKEFKKALSKKVQDTCGFEHLMAFCNFNNMTVHNAFHATFQTHTDKIYGACGIQRQRP